MDTAYDYDPDALVSSAPLPRAMRPRILIVDDSPEVICQIDALLQAQYSILVANSGLRALEILEQAPGVDLILLDVLMPDPDGFETCRRIKAHPDWCQIPLIFLTALDYEGHEVTGLSLGAVDYLAKPIVPAVLHARLNTHLELARVRCALQQHLNQLAEERALVEACLMRLHTDRRFDARYVRYFMQPVERTSGDLCLVAWTPDDRQWVLVGDFTGHGLIAALAGPLVKQIFYSHCAAGDALETLIATLDTHLYEQLPTGRFMAAYLAEVSADRQQLRLMNASMPEGLLFMPSGACEHLTSRALALGIAPEFAAPDRLQTLRVEPGARLLLVSDGVLETTAPDGEQFGLERLLTSYQTLWQRGGSLHDMLADLRYHRGRTALEDDVLILELTL
ncbi:PP2C family protein-serine/threonine phosphatase [Allochromatium warmingii]|nr:fused response regulator/phosphatase [Allochromatium warmingii]